MKFKVGDEVEYLFMDDGDHYTPIGVIAGFGSLFATQIVLVHLNKGFWTEGRSLFISTLSVHPSNLRKVEKD